MNYARDPDNLYDDAIVTYLKISVRRNGSMSVEGSIDDLQYALAMLDSAKDAVRNHHARNNSPLIVPPYDTGFAK
jgi:hypothetical protein